MRMDSRIWKCVLCGDESYNHIVCAECEDAEKDRQRLGPGSITQKQLNFIEYLMSGMTSEETSKIIFETLPDFDGSLEDLSMNKAGALIPKFINAKEDKNETPA